MSQVVHEDIVIAPLCSLVALEQQIYSTENLRLIIHSNVTSLKQCLPFRQYGSISVLLFSFNMGQRHILSPVSYFQGFCVIFSLFSFSSSFSVHYCPQVLSVLLISVQPLRSLSVLRHLWNHCVLTGIECALSAASWLPEFFGPASSCL